MSTYHLANVVNILIRCLDQISIKQIPAEKLSFSDREQDDIKKYIKETTKHILTGDLSLEESLALFLIFVKELSIGDTFKWNTLTKVISLNRDIITQEQIISLAKFEPKK